MARQRTPLQTLQQLQKKTSNIRNVCILAHVDHGKTTLADSLVASNGIISQRMAGKLRYLDSRWDEQERGITMKSSAIALRFEIPCKQHSRPPLGHTGESPPSTEEFLINLVDSPGHVDFTSEVTTAIRLCDAAIVVVDVIEGVCAQTKTALQLAYREQLQLVLVLNKIDRLILEKRMTPLDAYVHLQQVLEQVNAVTGEMFTKTVLEKMSSAKTGRDFSGVENTMGTEVETFDWDARLDEVDDSSLYFDPSEGNVVFASAADGWGFTLEDFARIYSKKMNVRFEILRKTLWGDFYLNIKAKKIQKGAQAKAKNPLFAKLVLQGIFDVYEAACINKDNDELQKMCMSLGVTLQSRELRQTDVKLKVASVMSSWIPLSRAVLRMVCTRTLPPGNMTTERVDHMLGCAKDINDPEVISLKNALRDGNSSKGAPVIVFVSKMIAVETSTLPENRAKPLTPEEMAARRIEAQKRLQLKQASNSESKDFASESEVPATSIEIVNGQESSKPSASAKVNENDGTTFIGFARVFSGILRKGAEVYVLGPKHDPYLFKLKHPDLHIDACLTLKDLKADEHVTRVVLDHLYLLMGRELAPVDEVPAGNILGIGGHLEHHVAKYATLSSSPMCIPFSEVSSPVVPILRVALEPLSLQDMPKLIQGMKLLNQADPCVQVILQETGEHVLVTVGEVHLERCLLDLKERFAKVDLTVSEPIVAFRETIVEPPKVDMVNEIIDSLTNKVSIRNDEKDKSINSDGSVTFFTPSKQSCFTIKAIPLPDCVVSLLDSQLDLLKEFSRAKKKQDEGQQEIDNDLAEKVEQFRAELQTIFNRSDMIFWKKFNVESIWSFGPKGCGPNILVNEISGFSVNYWQSVNKECGERHSLESSLVSGFQLATLAGPLCEEPVRGVAFAVTNWDIYKTEDAFSPYGPLSGQIMATVKDACRKAFQAQPQRLMAAMYECSIQVTAEALRKMYSVVGRRHGRIIAGDLVEGSSSFEVRAFLPVVESFQLADEMRKQTSGLAQPQLVFSHWEVIDIDPFWVPQTEEEYSHFGEKADSGNRAIAYINQVRRRKGLKVREHVVEHAEKQRTLSKKK